MGQHHSSTGHPRWFPAVLQFRTIPPGPPNQGVNRVESTYVMYREAVEMQSERANLPLVLEHHPRRPFPHLGRVPSCPCHDPILSTRAVSGNPPSGRFTT